ncbi:MAG: hypothetical protein KDA28_08730 [Phycisphaerales bacterium]|nr:hypothetical protein [Phycisphaerales bacterium]
MILMLVACAVGQYDMIDLGLLDSGERFSWAVDVADGGLTTGYAGVAGGLRPFLWDGEMHDLGTLGGGLSVGMAVNDLGMVAGYAHVDGRSHAFLWDGVMHDLGTLGGTESFSFDLNDQGHVTGFAKVEGGNNHAFLWDGTMHDLGAAGRRYSNGLAINESGDVAGYTGDVSFEHHPAVWRQGVAESLPHLDGFPYGEAVDINESGTIVGKAYGSTTRAVMWEDGEARDLGTLGGTFANAIGINDDGVVVGTTTDAFNSVVAFLWEDGTMHPLSEMVQTTIEFDGFEPKGISDDGHVAGIAIIEGSYHAVLLRPTVPAAPTALLLAGLAFMRRR